MSIQADTEMISIKAMEMYAKKNHISGEEVIELFHQYQIFEKIMIQHEYLHQVSFEEVMEYVEQVIREDAHKLAVFHGTTKRFDMIDLKNPIIGAILGWDFILLFWRARLRNGHLGLVSGKNQIYIMYISIYLMRMSNLKSGDSTT